MGARRSPCDGKPARIRLSGRLDNAAAIASFGLALEPLQRFLYAGFDHEFEKLRANPSVHWRAMQWAKAKGCRNYDMTGAGTAYPPHEGNWGYGLYQFKRGFGAELHYYAGYFDLVRLESTYSMIRYFEKNIVGRLHHLAAKTVASLMQFRRADS